jgi:phage gpG-like protein
MKKSSVIGTDELMRKFKSLDEGVQGENLALATDAGGMVILNGARKNIKDQGLIRTRQLSRSLAQEREEVTPTQVTNVIGTNVEYGPIHEFGGTIRAKNGKYLAIPIGSLKGSPVGKGLHLRKTRGNTLLLVDSAGEAQYVLKQSVTIPARPYLRPAHDDNQAKAQEAIARVLKKLVMEAASV